MYTLFGQVRASKASLRTKVCRQCPVGFCHISQGDEANGFGRYDGQDEMLSVHNVTRFCYVINRAYGAATWHTCLLFLRSAALPCGHYAEQEQWK